MNRSRPFAWILPGLLTAGLFFSPPTFAQPSEAMDGGRKMMMDEMKKDGMMMKEGMTKADKMMMEGEKMMKDGEKMMMKK